VDSGAATNLLTSLPAQQGALVGRTDELHELHEQVAEGRLVTVVGPGGIGKTRLVVALARDLACRGRRVGFVELADVLDGSEVVDALADQLAVEVVPGASRYDGLVHWLAAVPTVLVVDNLEHVIDAAADLMALVDECPGMHLVVTSRRALGVRDERIVRIGPLAATTPEGAAEAPGVQLMLERSHVAQPTATDIEAASRIVSGLGGLPLAIELAAFRARALGIAAVHELLVADLALSGLEGPDGPIRHRSLRRCLQWTYRDLDARARAVFHATGAFAGTFDLASLRSVVGDHRETAAGLATLVEHHLVDRIESVDGSSRFASIPPIREFARELLREDPERDAIIDAHTRWYASVASEVRTTFEGGKAEAAFATFQREQPNLVAAIAHRQRAGRYGEAAEIACDLAKIVTEFGREDQVSGWFRRVVRLAARADTPLPYEARIWAAYGDLVARKPGTSAPALAAIEAVIDAARVAGDQQAVLRGLERLTMSVLAHGDVGRALDASSEGIDLATVQGLRWPLAQLLTWHAMLLHVAGDIPSACRFGFDALRIARELDDGRLMVRVGLLFAPMMRMAEMDAEQVPSLAVCLELARARGSVIDEMYVTMQLAIRAGFEDDQDAFVLARRGLDLADRTRSHGGELIFVLALAGAAFRRGDDDVAIVLDAALRTEWSALTAVIPARGLAQYEDIVGRRRAEVPERFGRVAAEPALWTDVLTVAQRYANSDQPAPPEGGDPKLTLREREVLRELAEGRTNKEIAEVLGLRPKTVMHHCASIYRKLGVRTRAEATAVALRSGLLDPV
jgi:predicted ATPase/DNA-binding CsgD family transcriptional regulator